MKKLFIVIPAYNEADNIEQLVDDWYPVVNRINRESQLVIIDDGSKDDTYKILKKLTPSILNEAKTIIAIKKPLCKYSLFLGK